MLPNQCLYTTNNLIFKSSLIITVYSARLAIALNLKIYPTLDDCNYMYKKYGARLRGHTECIMHTKATFKGRSIQANLNARPLPLFR